MGNHLVHKYRKSIGNGRRPSALTGNSGLEIGNHHFGASATQTETSPMLRSSFSRNRLKSG
jgi:hypothetical protein